MQDHPEGSGTAVLWWLEAGDPAVSPPGKITAKFRVVTGPKSWTEAQPLSFAVGKLPGGPEIKAVRSWTPKLDGGQFGGHYNNGSFYLDTTGARPALNFLAQWPQSDPGTAGPNFSVHYNIVSVTPQRTVGFRQVTLTPYPLFVRELPPRPCFACSPPVCAGCPSAELGFYSELEGPVRFVLRDERTRRLLGSFTVEAARGFNSFRLGAQRPGRAGRFLVEATPLREPAHRFAVSVAAPEPRRARPAARPTRTARPDSDERPDEAPVRKP